MKEIKKCIICGKEFTSTCKNAMMCSAECKKIRQKETEKLWHKKRYKEIKRSEQLEKISTNSKTLEEKIKKANELGITYGKYIAKINMEKERFGR